MVATREHDVDAVGSNEIADGCGTLNREATGVVSKEVEARLRDAREDRTPIELSMVGHEFTQVFRIALERFLGEHVKEGFVHWFREAALGVALCKARKVPDGALDVCKGCGIIDSFGAMRPVGHLPLRRGLVDEDEFTNHSIREQLHEGPADCTAEAGPNHCWLIQFQNLNEISEVGGEAAHMETECRLFRVPMEA